VDGAFSHVTTVVCLDHQTHATSNRAHFILPAASFAEGDGTVVSMEGRAQRFFQLYNPEYYDPSSSIKEGWRWLHALHTAIMDREVSWTQFDEITEACATAIPALARIAEASPNASYRVKGLKIARAPRRYSGRTAMRANLSVHEPRASQDEDSPLAFSMEGYVGPNEDAAFVPFAWAPGWNSPQAWTKFQDEVGGHLRAGDAGVRLVESAPGADGAYFTDIPAPFHIEQDSWQVVPLHHIFGSDELSALAPATETLLEQPYVGLSPSDAQQLGVRDGILVKVRSREFNLSLTVRVLDQLPAGLVGLPVGLPGMPYLPLHVPVDLDQGTGV
jgi:NADH-quinone oxidoreductase subunit G